MSSSEFDDDESDDTVSNYSSDDYQPEAKVTSKAVTAKSSSKAAPASKKSAPAAKKTTGASSQAKPKASSRKNTFVTSSQASSVASFDRDDDEDDDDDDFMDVSGTSPPPNAKKPAAKAGKKTIEEIYQKKTQLEHILLRPDTYIGSTETIKQPMWVWDSQQNQMVHREISYVPGFYKIFDEILVNAADNKIRDPNMDMIKVSIDKENNTISVFNNGRGIPVEIHQKEKIYVPELIFGHLLTSSNYDDNERKVTGGRNGYGAKLCNIFSKQFIVETADKTSGKKFKQVFTNNMSTKSQPNITSNTKKEEYTRITFKPDLEKFGMTGIDDNIEALLKKRVYDIAGNVRDIKVVLNDERIKFKSFRQYIELYLASSPNELGVATKPTVVHEMVNDRWEIAFALSDGQFQQVSFVNSICTYKGGTHVNYIADQLAAKLVEAIQKKNKAAPVKPFQIKNHMWLFVNCLVENPTFDSQTKENMTLKHSAFGSKCAVGEDFINKVKKTGLIENVLSWAKFKQNQLLKKTDGSKRSRITGITKLDDANNAGTRNASSCTLILTEGDSAKTLAVTGLGVVGRDNFGVFPLRGKLLNVREASHKQIMENQEINYVKQILGLQHGKKYTDTSTLRYGHLMIMTDQDHDGSHIKGLILNFIDHFWPDLLRVPGFLCEFITPIVKVSKGAENGKRRQEIPFYTIPEYEAWKEQNNEGRGWTIKYYKGLGTSTKEDAKKYFSAIAQHRKPFQMLEEGDRDLIDMAFNKKKADNRKEWLRQFQPGTYMDHTMMEIPISDFINKELILFSMADNVRSIPNAVDGLKPGLRKIIFSCFKRNLVKGEIKVAQLAGYVSEHSAYHHGEQSLQSSIVGLAQNFIGSNNINLLEPRGQFGSRLQGGKDAASARYVFTRLSPLARKIFPRADDALLTYLNDDGQQIEPEWYMPILPLILVNGGEGIGTGWSSFVANYNPRDLVNNLKRMMRAEEPEIMHPWYRGFKGIIEHAGLDKYNITGIIHKTSPTTVEVVELPIRTWTQTYKEFLETLLNGTEKTTPFIKDYKEYHTESSVHFIISMSEDNMAKAEAEGLEKKFKLQTTMTTSNMVCFDQEGRIKKYGAVAEILEDFYHLRLIYYQKRKEFLVNQLTHDWTKLDNKVRFITEIVDGKMKIQNRKKADILSDLRSRGFKSFPKNEKQAEEEAEDADQDADDADHGYDYLLTMSLWSLSIEKVDLLKKERDGKQHELDELLATGVKELWRRDLDSFMEEWDRFESDLDDADEEARTKANKGKGSKLGAKPKKAFKFSKKLLSDDSEEEEDDIESDESDDYRPVKKQTKKSATNAAAPKPPSLKPAAPKPALAKPSAAAISKPGAVKTHQTSISSFLKPAEKKPFSTIAHSMDDEDHDAPVLSLAQMIERKKAEKRKEQEMNKSGMPSPKKVKSPETSRHGDDLGILSDQIESGLSLAATKASSKPSSKSKVAPKKTAVASKKKTIVIDSDEDEDSEPIAKQIYNTTTASKKSKPTKHSDSDASMEDLESENDDDVAPRSQPTRGARGARGATKKIQYVDVDSDEELDDTLEEEKEEQEEDEEESDDFEDNYASDDSA